MSMPVRFSFIIPVKDQVRLTRDCLLSWFAHIGSLRSQSEILIVDDGSSETSKSFLRSLPAPIRVLENAENQGFAHSNNRAAQEACGEFLIMLNNDLVLQRGWLDAMLAVVNAGSADRIVGNVQRSRCTGRVDHAGKFFDEGRDPRHFGQFHESLFPWDPPLDFCRFPSVTAACWLVKRSVFTGLGGFDTAYRNGFEDDDFCLRAAEQGIEVGVATRSWVYHYVSPSDGRKTHEDQNRNLFLERWGSLAQRWHDREYAPLLQLLRSWSCQK
ncbi:MAG: glycosyltransferase family 2 protein [Puniceicoccaceae bacterium]